MRIVVIQCVLIASACSGTRDSGHQKDSSADERREAIAAFHKSTAHALLCRIKNAAVDIPKLCTQIMCGPQRRAEEAFGDPVLTSHLPTLDDVALEQVTVGGNPTVCADCQAHQRPDLPTLKCTNVLPLPRPCSAKKQCADPIAGHKDDDPFVSPTSVNGFVITAQESAIYNAMSGSLIGIQFAPSGLTIQLPVLACSVSLYVGGWHGNVVATAYDKSAAIVDTKATPTPNQPHVLTLTGTDITRVTVTGGGREGALFHICARM